MEAIKLKGFVVDPAPKLVNHFFIYTFDNNGYFKLVEPYDYEKWDKKLKKMYNGMSYHRKMLIRLPEWCDPADYASRQAYFENVWALDMPRHWPQEFHYQFSKLVSDPKSFLVACQQLHAAINPLRYEENDHKILSIREQMVDFMLYKLRLSNGVNVGPTMLTHAQAELVWDKRASKRMKAILDASMSFNKPAFVL